MDEFKEYVQSSDFYTVTSTFRDERGKTLLAIFRGGKRVPDRTGFVFEPRAVGHKGFVLQRAARILETTKEVVEDHCKKWPQRVGGYCMMTSRLRLRTRGVCIIPSKTKRSRWYLYQLIETKRVKDEKEMKEWQSKVGRRAGSQLTVKLSQAKLVDRKHRTVYEAYNIRLGTPTTRTRVTRIDGVRTLVGQGSGGCAYRPSIPCNKTISHEGPTVSKLTQSRSDITELESIGKIDPKGEFHIRLRETCKFDGPLPVTEPICEPLLKHPMRQVYNLVLDDGGESLDAFLKRVQSPEAAIDVLRALGNIVWGTYVMFEGYFVHGDIKPSNIVMPRNTDSSGKMRHIAKLIDFGLSFQLEKSGGDPMRKWHLYKPGQGLDFYKWHPPELTCQSVFNNEESTEENIANIEKRLGEYGVPWSTDTVEKTANALVDLYAEENPDIWRISGRLIDTFSVGMVVLTVHKELTRQLRRPRHPLPRSLKTSLEGLENVAKSMTDPWWARRMKPREAVKMYKRLVLQWIPDTM